MTQSLTHEQTQQVFHLAQMGILAMCARGFSADEFSSTPEIESIRVIVSRPARGEVAAVDVEFVNNTGFAIGAMSL